MQPQMKITDAHIPAPRSLRRLLLVALLGAAALLLVPLAGRAAAMTCDGKHVTIMGTAGNDTIVGKAGSDVIYGGGGH